jgi:hypothetical protein
MQQGLVGYQRYLYLLGKWALTMETRSFAPPPIIGMSSLPFGHCC